MERAVTRRVFMGALGFLSAALGAHSAEKRPAYQVGCYTRPWDQHDYRVAFDGLAEAGYTQAGLMTTKSKSRLLVTAETTPDEVGGIKEEARRRGLRIISIYGGDFPVAVSVAAGCEGLKRLIDHCALCECGHLLLGGTGNAKLFDAYYQVVAECCPYAAAKKVVLSVKPHGGLNATGPQCRQIIEKVKHGNFRLWYDPGNIFYYSDGKLDPVADAATVDGLVCGMSIKDYLPPKQVEVTPGAGRVNFPAVLTRLRKGGFQSGPLVVECLTREEAADAKRITVEARKARLFLEQLLAAF